MQTDFESGPLTTVKQVPFGCISGVPPAEVFAEPLPEVLRDLPVLTGFFDLDRFDLTPELARHVGWGTVRLGGTMALTFRLQAGANVLYWLAHAADFRIWEVMDKWAAAGTMVLVAGFQGHPPRVELRARDFHIPPQIEELRAMTTRADELTEEFVTAFAAAHHWKAFKNMASTDIAAYPNLRHVQACMVVTPETRLDDYLVDASFSWKP